MKCLHCSLESDKSGFCCFGCKAAYSMITAAGLQNYYKKASEIISPKEQNKKSFEIFNHPDFLEKYSRKSDGYRTGIFHIDGLTCMACVWLIEHLPHINSNCIESRVNFGDSTIEIKWTETNESLSKLSEILAKLGYQISPSGTKSEVPLREWIRLGVSGASAAATMHLGLLLIAAHHSAMDPFDAKWIGIFSIISSLPALAWGGIPFYRTAWNYIKHRRLHPDFLITISALLGFSYSVISTLRGEIEAYYDALSMIIFLLLGSRLLLQRATKNLGLKENWRIHIIDQSGKIFEAPVSSVKSGARVLIHSSESIALDLVLESDEAWIDSSVLTGESLPALRLKGQKILQGSINSGAAFEAKVLNTSNESSFSKTLETVRARGWVSGSSFFETIFSFGILLLSLLGGLLSDRPIYTAISLLIVTCPCAILLAKPLALLSAQAFLKKKNILLIKPEKLLRLIGIKKMAFDKTGTLTVGALEVIPKEDQIYLDLSDDLSLFLELASKSEHPVSKALVAHLHRQKVRNKNRLIQYEEVPGIGICGLSMNRQKLEIKAPISNNNSSITSTSITVSLFLNDKEILAFELCDQLRPEAFVALSKLKEIGFELNIVSGDQMASVESALAKCLLLFSNIKASLLPQQKAEFTDETTAMVGDGLSDALAFQRAGFSIGFFGSAESNLGTADCYLLEKNLCLIPEIVALSKKVQKMIRLNIGISIAYNIIAVLLVFYGIAGPILCAIFMPLSSLSVILISSRLNKKDL